ncbi:cryptococcal mannosyltransferase 1-domain-containing protein [Echria macrotheca]|uniref:Cryptococcal mannosyltransferase 1-domain-containing protein n=1 Tax=Echria macrotheca TaxID=438768 RepID=A0AAJ0BBG4_9PEZI|nr:cryptococcal mannosyltransferase 1-domain-containing protein [Echria macrotheca]
MFAITSAPGARRKIRIATAFLLAVLTLVVLGRDRIVLASSYVIPFGPGRNGTQPAVPTILSTEERETYLRVILDPSSTELPRLECPQPDLSRYEYLKPRNTSTIQYFFALDLRQCLPLLPRLIGSIIETIRFLGPEHCALSIVEGNSDDGTAEVLSGLRPALDALTTTYYFRSSSINPSTGDRIARLAELRNLAVQPLLTSPTLFSPSNTTVLFLNDVAICPEDTLELVHQRRRLGADMTCAMDWTYVGRDPTFYDVWIARGMNGDSFFDIPPDGNWNSAWNLFWNDAATQARYADHKPFQVFSCWNGAVAFTAEPIMSGKVAFRGPREDRGECMQGEPQLFCKDMWWHGYRRIAVVPSISLEYSDERGKQIKDAKGYTSRWVKEADADIEWQSDPPDTVKCIPKYENQYFEAWNKTQGEGLG